MATVMINKYNVSRFRYIYEFQRDLDEVHSMSKRKCKFTLCFINMIGCHIQSSLGIQEYHIKKRETCCV